MGRLRRRVELDPLTTPVERRLRGFEHLNHAECLDAVADGRGAVHDAFDEMPAFCPERLGLIEASDERIGTPVYVLEGERTNFKITVPEDVWLAEMLIGGGRLP